MYLSPLLASPLLALIPFVGRPGPVLTGGRSTSHRLPEQRAIIHLLWSRDFSDHVQIVSQRRYRRGDFLIHFLDMKPQQRIRWMRQYEQFAKA